MNTNITCTLNILLFEYASKIPDWDGQYFSFGRKYDTDQTHNV